MTENYILTAIPLAIVAAVFFWTLATDLCRQDTDERHGSASLILAAMLSLPGWYLDKDDTPEQRSELYRPVADAIHTVAKNRRQQAFLVTQAWAETKFARYVLEDRCQDGPIGARCDRGKASGPWQVWSWCKDAHDKSLTNAQRFEAGARCALRGYHQGARMCTGYEGMFIAQRGGMLGSNPCQKQWAIKRAKTMKLIEVRL